METLSHTNSVATEAAFDRMDAAIEGTLAGRAAYPSGTAFVPADHPDVAGTIRRYLDEGRPVVLVYDDGSEQVLGDPHRPLVFVVGPLIASLRDHGARLARRFRRDPTLH